MIKNDYDRNTKALEEYVSEWSQFKQGTFSKFTNFFRGQQGKW